MKKMNKREGLLVRIIRGIFKKELLKNKLYAIVLLTLGYISVGLLDGDITGFILLMFFALALFFAKENAIS